METEKEINQFYDPRKIEQAIKNNEAYETNLEGPTDSSRDFIQTALELYLKTINRENIHNILCLCMEEIISNSVKANIKRAWFLHNNLDINDHAHYKKGMEDFREMGLSKVKKMEFIKTTKNLGFYVRVRFEIKDNIFTITTRNNSVISPEELERINNKLKLSEKQTSEELFMNSVDTTEGCGLGIIMITKIMKQVSSLKDCFSIYADNTDTITVLKIDFK